MIAAAALAFVAAAMGATSVQWQQVGGSFQKSPGLATLVGQAASTESATDADGTLQPGFLSHPLLVNGGPFAASPLADLVQHVGFAPIDIDLDTVFTDFDGDALTYSVVPPSSAPLSVRTEGSHLRLAPIGDASGTGDLVVVASDGTFEARDTFRVKVEPSSGIVARPSGIRRSTELAAHVERSMTSIARSPEPGRVGTGADCCPDESCQSVAILLPGAASVNVAIFDNLGNPVIAWDHEFSRAELSALPREADSRVPLHLSWNLRAANGTPVGAGVYLWRIQVRTPDGATLETVKRLGAK